MKKIIVAALTMCVIAALGASPATAGKKKTTKGSFEAQAIPYPVTGTVDDIRPYVHRAAVYIAPLRIAGGTRLKLFEALAMGKAVVSTTIGAEGLPLVEGEHVVRADDPAAFADAVVALLRDPARRRALGQAGRRMVEERYAWPQVAREFEAHCAQVLQ